MSDRYQSLVASGAGARAAKALGLPRPERLRRSSAGDEGLPGPVRVVAAPESRSTLDLVGALGHHVIPAPDDPGDVDGDRLGAVVVDATAAATIADLEAVRAGLAPSLRRLAPSGRVVLLGRPPAAASSEEVDRATVQQALEGVVRTVGKELRRGATANLVRVEGEVTPGSVGSTLGFLLSPRSAYVDGQVVTVGAPVSDDGPDEVVDEGRVAVVTGAARGIGAAIAAVLARRGAHVVAVDVPGQGEALAAVANRIGGTALHLDITAEQAPAVLADHLLGRHGRLDVVVHNAGITRDRLLVNTDADRWSSVIEVNLAAQQRIDARLLATDGLLATGARIVAVSSTSGLAGNRGQANYAASKAGVAGRVRALAPHLASRGVTVNAVAPGFIETEMTGRIPLVLREVGRRANSLSQAGLPEDVAETVAWLADPGSGAVTGQVVRVCGQSLVGA